ncbi:Serine/threonine-protein phosphatase PP1 isozyme 5 [Tritrichomonas foetus]|uniref:Serine/threonine-protein phosphatase n=1 Tax=Tritrichomonas foetus TaxID=1144522 RepID=A0A1J4J7Z8_9EUKA|nr:Serine/threonine-protein phosphatase PP1 isozyme 5 [Tritrichomonas foetus]|eukprot:OHS95272.1 Serine/threonine-protein phosphatase PP1 isozyme 5 [Tritrichomonas foetus]
MNAVSFVMKCYTPLLHLDINDILKIGKETPLPRFDEQTLIEMLELAEKDFSNNPALVMTCESVIIIGDLHGNLHDFLRIINGFPDPLARTFLLLGDYVDRGNFQTELMTLLIALTIQYPLNFILLRGNHEFREVNAKGGFYDEITSVYSDKVYEMFNQVFSLLPLAAIIEDKVFCVHGGIGPHLKSISQIKAISLPYQNYGDDNIIKDMMWSDPSYDGAGFDNSPRGVGHLYGNFVLSAFLKNNNLLYLVRGHESISSGIQCDELRKVFTVFSSSGYKDGLCLGAYMTINKGCKLMAYTFKFIGKIRRRDANFYTPQIHLPLNRPIHSFKSLSFFPLVTNQPTWRRRGKMSFLENDKISGARSMEHFSLTPPPHIYGSSIISTLV